MSKHLLNISDGLEVTAEKSLEDAANYYLEKLIPNIPQSLLKKKHMRDQISVKVDKDEVKVVFGETAFYWRFAENGTGGKHPQRAQHFARGTYEQNREAIEDIMTKKIIQKVEG